MDVIFQPNRGNPFCIEIGYFDTVLEIKEKIQKDQGIPISKQTLVFNGHRLNDELNIHDSEILDHSRIQLLVATDHVAQPEFSSPSKIQLLLKMPASKQGIALEIDVNETISTLKEKIHKIEGIPASRLVIHAKEVELQDHKSVHECELSDNSEVDVVIRSSPGPTSSGSSSGNTSGSKKLRIIILTKCGTKKILLEVNSSDTIGDLRTRLQKMKEQLQLDLPQEGYFFIYKQNVMDDDRSFRWHHVGQGDTIEIFSGIVSGGS